MSDDKAFALSRVYASGWNSGKKSVFASLDEAEVLCAQTNPHTTPDEKARWSAGFMDACHRTALPSKSVGKVSG